MAQNDPILGVLGALGPPLSGALSPLSDPPFWGVKIPFFPLGSIGFLTLYGSISLENDIKNGQNP